jgi:hypothetical protein
MNPVELPKLPLVFSCQPCCFTTSNKKDYKRHILTAKHQRWVKLPQITPEHKCQCGNIYKYRQGLNNHKKKCSLFGNNIILKTDDLSLKEMFIEVVKQNQEMRKTLETAMSHINNNNNTINNTINNTTNNNQFNLNFFLNEQCKDALNIMDFIDSLKVQLSDLESVGELGYSEGLSNIFINALKELDIFKRPIHCSDVKRETMYLRDDDTWEKDNEKREKLKKAINRLADKNIQQIPIWMKENPDAMEYDSKKQDEYFKIIGESMGGKTDEETERNMNKIIKNIAKEVVIEK